MEEDEVRHIYSRNPKEVRKQRKKRLK